MMKFNEWYSNKENLFDEIVKETDTNILKDYGTEKVELLYKTLYGEREVPSSVKNRTVNDVAKLIAISYGDNWDKQYQTMVKDLEFGIDNKKKVKEKGSDKTRRNTENEKQTKVSAFNDDDYTPSDKDVNMSDDTEESENDKTTETTTQSFEGTKNQIAFLQQSFIKDVVCYDVSKLLSLSIY